jgi:hypothetical protein
MNGAVPPWLNKIVAPTQRGKDRNADHDSYQTAAQQTRVDVQI